MSMRRAALPRARCAATRQSSSELTDASGVSGEDGNLNFHGLRFCSLATPLSDGCASLGLSVEGLLLVARGFLRSEYTIL